MRNGENEAHRRRVPAAQNEGWEKQYPYKVGKKKVYMTPSAARRRAHPG